MKVHQNKKVLKDHITLWMIQICICLLHNLHFVTEDGRLEDLEVLYIFPGADSSFGLLAQALLTSFID